jgi:gamma-glutamyltranspeptidase / glutathione hydrolase
MTAPRGVIAAGHAETAAAGAGILRTGGNAVDAAVAAMLASFAAEPLLTGPGAGGYMLVVGPGGERELLDFFVEAPGRGADAARRGSLQPVEVSFGDALQVFHYGPASCGVYGTVAGACAASQRFGTAPLEELAAPAVRLAREGVQVTRQQAYIFELLAGIIVATPEARALYAPGGRPARPGDVLRNPELADSLERLAREGVAPFYSGDLGAAVADWLSERGGLVTRQDLAAYEAIERSPVTVRYRGHEVLTNPPPSAGGILIAYALALLEREPLAGSAPSLEAIVAAMERAQRERTPEFLDGLASPGFERRFLASRLGSTTHISVLDVDGWACSVTCSNGEGSAVVVPGTGIHVNNMLGEEDLNPAGFHRHPTGRRLPSMMAPTVVLRDGEPHVVLGSAGSNRIRSAILQTVVNVVDQGMSAGPAVEAPRVHWEDGVVFAEPGLDLAALERAGYPVTRFRARNMFFGGVQAAERDAGSGSFSGAADPRRGGAATIV